MIMVDVLFIYWLRQMWKKFGDAVDDRGKGKNGEGPDPATTLIADEVFLTLTTNKEVMTSPLLGLSNCMRLMSQ